MTWLTNLLQSLSRPLQWWVVVAPWEQGCRVRLGKKSKLLGPGIHFRVPFLDRVYVAGTRLRNVSNTGLTCQTRDIKSLTVSISVLFRIENLEKLLQSTSSPEEVLLSRASCAVVRAADLTRSEDLTPARLADVAQEAVPMGWGLADVEVQVTAYAIVRTLRVMTAEYSARGDLDAVLKKDEARAS